MTRLPCCGPKMFSCMRRRRRTACLKASTIVCLHLYCALQPSVNCNPQLHLQPGRDAMEPLKHEGREAVYLQGALLCLRLEPTNPR